MKRRLIALIVLFTMTTGLPAVQAGDRVYRHSDRRLGERVRDGFAIYRNGYRVPGSAIALADGWALGTARESGGFAIFRWNGRHWDQAPGGAVEIGGTYQRWVINNRGQPPGTGTIGIRILMPRIERKGLTHDVSIRGLTIPFAVGDSPKAVAISGLTAGDMLVVQTTGVNHHYRSW